jgi:hypothetical protein
MQNLRNTIGFILNKIWRIKIAMRIDRKQFVCQIIRNERPTSILEIGARNGTLAKKMLATCKEIGVKPSYVGIDLFSELMDENIFNTEVSQWPNSLESVYQELSGIFPEYKIELLQGFSDKILKEIVGRKFDLIIIDGGHSFETVLSDWKYAQGLIKSTGSVVFDDYTNDNGSINGNIGVKEVVDNYIDGKTWGIVKYSTVDVFMHKWGLLKTRMVQVKTLNSM